MFIVAFTPKPRVVKLRVLPLAKEPAQVGEAMVVATRYHIRPELGLFASLLITNIPDICSGFSRAWRRPSSERKGHSILWDRSGGSSPIDCSKWEER